MLSQGILTYRSLTVNPERLDRIGGSETLLWKTAAKAELRGRLCINPD
jgi:hypothetical protein